MFAALARRWRGFLEGNSLLREYLWKYRRLVTFGVISLTVVDLLEIIPPILLMDAVDLVARGERDGLMRLAWLYLAVAVGQSLGRYGWRIYLIRASMFAGRDIRNRFVRHLFHLSASFFDKRRIGDLMSLGTSDVEAVRMAMGPGLLTLADALVYLLTVPIAMYMISPQLTLISFIALPIIPFVVHRNEREIHSRFTDVQESFSRLSAMAQENLGGIRVVKGFAAERSQWDRLKDAGKEHIRLSLRLARVQTAFGPILDFLMSVGLVLLIAWGGKWVITDAVTIGTFVAFQRYIQKLVWPMSAVGLAFSFYQRSVASGTRIKEVLEHKTDTPESPTTRLPAGFSGRAQGRVEFKRLTFAFPGSDTPVLHDISVTIEPGQRVAFVGAIGSGKTALLGVLPRLYPVAPGMALVDGVDVNDWPIKALRNQIGYVSQDVFLFSMSVTENLAFGLVQADRTRLELATQIASVHNEIEGLPEAYQTTLGERGVNLSGGQKQRITIARAIALQPAILVLDDALAAVDVQTEERILTSLRNRPGRNTELISAHRISTIQDADQIIVLEKGRIIQQGKHSSLIRNRGGLYYRYYEQQRLKEDLEAYVRGLS